MLRSLKYIKSAAWLTTYLLGSDHHIHVLYMFFSVFFPVCLFFPTLYCVNLDYL